MVDLPLGDRLFWLVERLKEVGSLVSTVHDRVTESKAINQWHTGFHGVAESLFAADIDSAGLTGEAADAMLRIGTFVVEGLLTHATPAVVSRAVIEQLVDAIAPENPAEPPLA